MFKLFGGSKNYSIGIDFGTSAIKVVELCYKNQKLRLNNYGWVDLGLANPSSIKNIAVSEVQDSYNKKLQKYLEKLVKSMRLASDSAYISLPGFSGLITVIEFPDMESEDLEEAIRFEARKYIPISLDEVALDWEIIGEKKQPEGMGAEKADDKAKSDKKNEILLVAAPKNEVIRCGNIVKGSGLNVKNVELETFSLARAMVGNDPGCFLIVDIGARISNIILVEKGVIKVSRNIEGGGNEITNVVADSLNISKQRAEELKKENKDLLNNREMSLSIPVLDMIVSESIRIINAYKEKKGEAGRVDAIILSGGSAKLKGIDAYFNKKIGIQANIGNPWRRVECNESITPFVEKIGTSFSVALGLAIRGIEESGNN